MKNAEPPKSTKSNDLKKNPWKRKPKTKVNKPSGPASRKEHKTKSRDRITGNYSGNPRLLAAEVILELENNRSTLDRLLEEKSEAIEALNSRDRGLFNTLVYGIIRWRGRLDWILATFSRKPLAKLDQAVLAALRLGLFQLLYLDRVPQSAAVNTAVETSKILGGRSTGAFVNAVLRNAVRGNYRTSWPGPRKDPLKYISATQSIPAWMADRWLQRFGFHQTEQLCQALNTIPDIVLRTNRLKRKPELVIELLKDQVQSVRICSTAPDGIRLHGLGRPVSSLAGFREGLFQVQGEASQLVAYLLELAPGMRVWDACAGLGTKSCQMAIMMQDKGLVLASDNNSTRLASLEKEKTRLGISSIRTKRLDLLTISEGPACDRFDRILLDAPCSALGVIQKNPDVKWFARQDRLPEYGKRQLAMLNQASKFLHPGGILVYSVCSFEPEETVEVIKAFLKSEQKFDIYRPKASHWLRKHITPAGFLQTLPHRNKMSGFFAVALRRHS